MTAGAGDCPVMVMVELGEVLPVTLAVMVEV